MPKRINSPKEEGQMWERCPRCGGDLIRLGSNGYVSRWKCLKCKTVWVLPAVKQRKGS